MVSSQNLQRERPIWIKSIHKTHNFGVWQAFFVHNPVTEFDFNDISQTKRGIWRGREKYQKTTIV
jgi:hypothetical protein